MHDSKRIVTREELYELVWSKPIRKIALDFGVSDSAIHKACKRMEVPRPGLGHWAKVEAGKPVPEKPPLLEFSDPNENFYRSWTIYNSEVNKLFRANAVQKPEFIEVPKKLTDPHPLVEKSIKAFNKAKLNEKYIQTPKVKRYLDISVTEKCIDRALLIMDALLKALETRHYEYSIDTDNKTVVRVNDEELAIGIDEKVRQIPYVPPLRKAKRYPDYSYVYKRFDYEPTGILSLKIRNSYASYRKSWSDAKVQVVEDCLGSFILGLEVAAASEKEQRRINELKRLEWEEKESQWKAKRETARIEELKIKKLTQDIESWEKANRIRSYMNELMDIRRIAEVDDLSEWINWGYSYADSLDPLQHLNQIVFKKEDSEVSPSNYWD